MTYNISTGWAVLLAAGAIWELAWKGIALWHAARDSHPAWFICMLAISSVGVLPILYLLSHHEYSHRPAAYRGAT
ncbi:MAG TPA: DUF5652 family protein [Candidatus Saccharimonadales bacterium]|nr:DUF5652 family protein [Candidatus Saccharimonadales bacterium]